MVIGINERKGRAILLRAIASPAQTILFNCRFHFPFPFPCDAVRSSVGFKKLIVSRPPIAMPVPSVKKAR